MQVTHLFGLNSLRFLAAATVLLAHALVNLHQLGLYQILDPQAVLERARLAVNLFFCLSGFLITLLLRTENRIRKTINLRKFFARRFLRIAPLYVGVVLFGLIFYFFVLPAIGINYTGNTFSLGLGIILYAMFLPQFVHAFYNVGGILGVTWSIGIELQFYLVWAPFLRFFGNNLKRKLVVLFILLCGFHYLNNAGWLAYSDGIANLVSIYQIQYMVAGALSAVVFLELQETGYFRKTPDNWRLFSLIAQLGVILTFVFYCDPFKTHLQYLAAPVIFGIALLAIAATSNQAKNTSLMTNRLFEQIGEWSYGIYMYHYIVIYAISFGALKLTDAGLELSGPGFLFAFVLLTLSTTIIVSAISYKVIESKFLRLRPY